MWSVPSFSSDSSMEAAARSWFMFDTQIFDVMKISSRGTPAAATAAPAARMTTTAMSESPGFTSRSPRAGTPAIRKDMHRDHS